MPKEKVTKTSKNNNKRKAKQTYIVLDEKDITAMMVDFIEEKESLGFMPSNIYGEGDKSGKGLNKKTSIKPNGRANRGLEPESAPPTKHEFVVNSLYKETKKRRKGKKD